MEGIPACLFSPCVCRSEPGRDAGRPSVGLELGVMRPSDPSGGRGLGPWPWRPARCETDKTSMQALFSSPGLGSGQWAALVLSIREAELDVACVAEDSPCGPFSQTVPGPSLVSELLSQGAWIWSLFVWN